MASMMVQQQVKDFAVWKIQYDSMAEKRVSYGALSNTVYRDATDPNKIIIVSRWKSMADAKKWAESPELKAAMEKAGVIGPPVFSFLSEA